MKHWRWPLLFVLICLPVALLAVGVRMPWIDAVPGQVAPLPVYKHDREIAWLHTTTSFATWERFVFGIVRSQMTVPGLTVDDSAAFSDSTTSVPELVLSMEGRTGKLRIRWYKLRSDATAGDWVRALGDRNPAPLAIIGGGSTDRAVELAVALEARKQWIGDRPPLFITTATANRVHANEQQLVESQLVDLYPGRTFRFCFTNRQMADAVLDFVEQSPELRPQLFDEVAVAAAASGLTSAVLQSYWKPNIFSVQWNDDPYSTDLHEQFKESLRQQARRNRIGEHSLHISSQYLPFSVGGFNKANAYEARTAESISKQLIALPPQRAILILPAVTQPARRLLHAIIEADPRARRRLVVVTGDGIPVNAMIRDGDFAWPMASLGVPIVFFTHANPVGWDTAASRAPTGYPLYPPNSTEEAAHFGEMGRILAATCFASTSAEIVRNGDDLIANLHAMSPPFFDRNGERLGGRGEHVVVAMPRYRDAPDTLAVWRRQENGQWQHLETITPNAGGGR